MALSQLSRSARIAPTQCHRQQHQLITASLLPMRWGSSSGPAADSRPQQHVHHHHHRQQLVLCHATLQHYTTSSSSSRRRKSIVIAAAAAAGRRGSTVTTAAAGAGVRRSTVTAAAAAGRRLPVEDPRKDFDGKFGNGSASLIPEEALAELTPEEVTNVTLFRRASPSVVNINTSANIGPFNLFQIPRGVGSGFIWDKEGHVVTNAHVVAGADAVKVTLSDSRVYEAEVQGKDREKDVAVLRLKGVPPSVAAQLTPVVLGSSSNLLVGQKVYCIGNPFGLDQTLTQGVISGLGRELPAYGNRTLITNVIQTDAAINPGNSGGVMLDSKGRLVGINTAILDPSGSGQFSGVGFAIPIDSAKGLVQQILQYGRVMRPYLGVSLAPASLLSQLGIKGVLVLEVAPTGPAARAGLQATKRELLGIRWGDIIISMDGEAITNERDLFACLDEHRPGQKVEMGVQRGIGPSAQKRTVRVTLADRRDTAGE